MSTSRIIRKYERFLFNAVTEHPEPIWERDDHNIASVRHTGMSQVESDNIDNGENLKNIGFFVYDFKNKTEVYQIIDDK